MKKKICLIDDDASYRYFANVIIKSSETSIDRVIEFSTADAALSFFKIHGADRSQLPDIVLLDINMPRMSGWEFIQEFSKLDVTKSIDVYIVSTSQNEDDKRKAETYSLVRGYLDKPFTATEFEALCGAPSRT